MTVLPQGNVKEVLKSTEYVIKAFIFFQIFGLFSNILHFLTIISVDKKDVSCKVLPRYFSEWSGYWCYQHCL